MGVAGVAGRVRSPMFVFRGLASTHRFVATVSVMKQKPVTPVPMTADCAVVTASAVRSTGKTALSVLQIAPVWGADRPAC